MIIMLVLLLLGIFILWKLFVDGWLFKIVLFFAGWFGLYIWLRVYVEGAKTIAFTYHGDASNVAFTWAAVIPTAVCIMALLCTKVRE